MPDDALAYAPPSPLALLHVTHTFAAPRERVFRAWTEPEAVSRWFGAEFDPPPTVEADVRVGGRYRIVWTPAAGELGELGGTYLEVKPPERLVYTFAWQNVPQARGAGNSKVTVEFHDLGDETEVRLTHELLDEEPVLDFHRWGWETSVERLALIL